MKSIGTDLRENHLRQATDYAANQGVEWILLTNGAKWQAHRVRFEQPIQTDQVFTIDLLDDAVKASELVEKLYLVSKEGANTTAIEAYWQRKEATSRYVIAQLVLAEPTLTVMRRQLRQLFPGLKASEDDITELLQNEVLKRDALEGDRAVSAQRAIRKGARRYAKTLAPAPPANQVPQPLAERTTP